MGFFMGFKRSKIECHHQQWGFKFQRGGHWIGVVGIRKKTGPLPSPKNTPVNSEHVRSGKNPENRGLALTPVVLNSKGGVRNFTFSLESDLLTNHVLKVEALD